MLTLCVCGVGWGGVGGWTLSTHLLTPTNWSGSLQFNSYFIKTNFMHGWVTFDEACHREMGSIGATIELRL